MSGFASAMPAAVAILERAGALPDFNRAMSTATERRYGRHGSKRFDIKSGLWSDYEAGERGGVLQALEHFLGVTKAEAARMLDGAFIPAPLPKARTQAATANRSASALRLWAEGCDPRGTIVQFYLRSRGVDLPERCEDIRFHPRCPFGSSRVPAMLALMRDIHTDEPRAVHRTALDGEGRKTGRKMLGPCAGAVIKLNDDAEVTIGLGLAEGIETALSVIGAGWRPLWACGDAGHVEAFPVLNGIEALTIFADNDESGTGQRAARAVATRYADAGRWASVQLPPRVGMDFNDVRRAA